MTVRAEVVPHFSWICKFSWLSTPAFDAMFTIVCEHAMGLPMQPQAIVINHTCLISSLFVSTMIAYHIYTYMYVHIYAYVYKFAGRVT